MILICGTCCLIEVNSAQLFAEQNSQFDLIQLSDPDKLTKWFVDQLKMPLFIPPSSFIEEWQ